MPGQRQRERELDAAHFGPAASAIRETFENPAWFTRPNVSISCA